MLSSFRRQTAHENSVDWDTGVSTEYEALYSVHTLFLLRFYIVVQYYETSLSLGYDATKRLK